MNVDRRPLLRGYFHAAAFFMSLSASIFLLVKSQGKNSFIPVLIYALSVNFLFGISALYHRFLWSREKLVVLKRLDHSMIFIAIAGTCTPIVGLALPVNVSVQLLTLVWIAAGLGVFKCMVWIHSPKWVTASFYIATGWLVALYLPELSAHLSPHLLYFIVAGGVLYTIGGIFYALKRPNLFPQIFGYHEAFHLLVVIAAFFHFVVVYNLA